MLKGDNKQTLIWCSGERWTGNVNGNGFALFFRTVYTHQCRKFGTSINDSEDRQNSRF